MTPATRDKFELLTQLTKGYQAFLYDCDGTLADNMPAHKETYVRAAQSMGHIIEGDIVDELAGWPVIDVVKEINKRYSTNFDPLVFKELKYKLFLEEYITLTKPVAYVAEHLKAHVGKVKIAVVSGSGRSAVEKTLEVLGLINLIDVIICAGETPNGKPHPDPFLAAAHQLNIAPHNCIVFEDGGAGEESARRAGMPCVRVDKL